jgi:myo-inositol-1-phosphate synthase
MGDTTVRVAVVGVGNCCSALVQGIHYYKTHAAADGGVSYPVIGGYKPSDVVFVEVGVSTCHALFHTRL